ncbi:hypothetical protein Lsai_3084 [Legionella sainthelensi]|uniref:Transmembrane protein n=1 Tax=Legionella sainthelensi TaxID=28087 RepID=A0A0W0YCB4_9GAMM|nr:hypothetical protein [Legionella sainthelensi]KTD54262.1 hypothetical protein Lsai_3084 [Legionella sainthelensi]VEH30018.1 Uncharacterised protein [Legionella sainthelensi]
MFKEIENNLTYGMVWFLTLSFSFLITTIGILVVTYAYVIFHSKHINSKLSVGNVSAEISNFQNDIDTAMNTNNALLKQNNQLLETVEQFPELMTGNNFAVDKSLSKDEINKLTKGIRDQLKLLESQKNSLNLLNQNLSKFKTKVGKEEAVSE